jgi:hypothetical protein
MDPSISARVVRDYRGQKVPGLAKDANAAKAVIEKENESVGFMRLLDRAIELGEKGSAVNYAQVQEVNNTVDKMLGKMRLSFLGPGVMTDNERAYLKTMIGNPLSMLSYKPVEMKKLMQLKNDGLDAIETSYKTNGLGFKYGANAANSDNAATVGKIDELRKKKAWDADDIRFRYKLD